MFIDRLEAEDEEDENQNRSYRNPLNRKRITYKTIFLGSRFLVVLFSTKLKCTPKKLRFVWQTVLYYLLHKLQ
jgi:hypothetical protein